MAAAVADTPEQPVVDAEEGESLAGWLAERPLGEEDEARLASVISVPAADAEVLPEDDDWTQPPLEELARLAKEAPLATPEPDAEIIEPAAPAPDVVTHWPADEEAALLPGFDVLPELGSADEPAPLAFVAEKDAARWAQHRNFPIIPCNLCGSQENLQRKQIGQMLRDWQQLYPGRIENMAVALRNLVPSHFMDTRQFDFKGLVPNGVADADGDKAFDAEEFPAQAVGMLAGLPLMPR